MMQIVVNGEMDFLGFNHDFIRKSVHMGPPYARIRFHGYPSNSWVLQGEPMQ